MNSELYTETAARVLVSLLFAGATVWAFLRAGEQAETDAPGKKPRQRYLPYLAGWVLPLYVAFTAILLCLTYGPERAARALLSLCFPIFLSICVYDALLLPALPLLRRRISARTCAALWLLPTYLYLTAYPCMERSEPRWVVSLPVPVIWVGAVWATGFCAVLGWKIADHLRFRRALLKSARPVEDPDDLALWQEEQQSAGRKKIRLPLLVSPAVSTPLSVGLFSRSIRVVLPERTYTAEDLRLILRHEIIHISRTDSAAKFFLVFCTAMCWFNPLMWLAKERSAQDLELSCDETVLLDAGDGARRRYAELLLSAAGNGRGFTTCLSASAKTLRYRLRSVVHPPRRHGGALLAGVLMFALLMTSSLTALAYDPVRGAEVFFPDGQEAYTLRTVQWHTEMRTVPCRCADPEALASRLGDLKLEALAGKYTFSGIRPLLEVCFEGPEGTVWIVVREKSLSVIPMGRPSLQSEGDYYLPQGADLEALAQLLTFSE